MELRVGHLPRVVELDRDPGVTLDARYVLDRDLLHGWSPGLGRARRRGICHDLPTQRGARCCLPGRHALPYPNRSLEPRSGSRPSSSSLSTNRIALGFGGQPGTWTSTLIAECSGSACLSSAGTPSVGTPRPSVAPSTYTRSSSFRVGMPLRIDGTLPVTAQSPSATTILLRSRAVSATSRSSWLLTAPSISATSTPSGHSCASTSGPNTMSAFSSTPTIPSSRSSSDIWQPEQPSSQHVPIFTLSITGPRVWN